MREKIVNGLSALGRDIVLVTFRLSPVLDADRNRSLLFAEYTKEVLLWMTRWHADFIREVDQASDSKKLKFIIQRKSLELRAYFFLRHSYLPFPIADFTYSPFMMINKLLLTAAKLIMKEDESVCTVMMPWVERVIGYADEADIKAATEDADGHFELWPFVGAGDDQHALISVMDYLDYVRDSHDIAKKFFTSNYPEILERKLGVPFKNYVRALDDRYRKTTLDKSCFAYYLQALAVSLHERSISREGQELAAAEKYESIIAHFYALWKSLPERARKSIADLKTSVSEKYTLEDYLLVVFASAPSVQIQLSPSDLQRERKNNIINCANILSSVLLSFLHKNMENWSRLVVGNVDSISEYVIYSQEQLDCFRNELNRAMNTPSARTSDRYVLICAINSINQPSYREFLFITKLLISVDDDALSDFFGDFKNRFASPQSLFAFFSNLKNKKYCSDLWAICSGRWKKLFTGINDIIELTHFLNDPARNLVIDDFKNEIIAQYQPPETVHPDNPSLAFSFMLKVIKKIPEKVNTLYFLTDGIFLCQSKQDLELFFSAVAPRLESLFSVDKSFFGGRWIVFLEMLRVALSSRALQLDKKMIYTVCFESILPIFLGNDRIIDLYWKESLTSCWSCFFSSRLHEKDLLAHDALVKIYAKFGLKMDMKSLIEVIYCLSNFVEENEGGRFLKKVKAAFHEDFFHKTKDVLRMMRFSRDLDTSDPCLMAML